MHESLLGGGFGGKQDYDEILAAAYCAKEVGRPVKLIQTRESKFATSFPRTPTYHRLKAGLKKGQLVAMDHDICCGWMGPRFSVGKKFGTDWLQLDSWDAKKEDIDQWSIGGSDHWYDVENNRVRAFDSDRTTWAVQASALRTVSNSYNMFVVESFMDEVAHALNRDPLEFRLALLNGKGGSRGIPNAGYAPGTPSDYYMDRLWISLPWPNDNSWPLYEIHDRWRSACASPIACVSRLEGQVGARRSCRPTPEWASPYPPPRNGRVQPGSPASRRSRSIPRPAVTRSTGSPSPWIRVL